MVLFKILIGATGSVAAIKIPVLSKLLIDSKEQGFDFELQVRIIMTENAKHFFELSELPPLVDVYDDASEWNSWKGRGDPVLHIELGKWADLMVIAPLDANTLAKMAQGICDNLLTCTTRAWDLSKPLLFCPAMNTRMWEHPITSKQITTLKEWGHIEIPPIEKTLMCGDKGVGAMAEVTTIVDRIKTVVSSKS
ncbi:phosphopantothenoylcysteine decarboxylase isoform X1 [Amyelois transitella]|uniref:phosphopantothenoylcysteine decarboxylase isoform X1 n=1 Tax=Amyelois transitella TaxID=680683 RepID=UPI00298F9458|nr:phosphopantothenoylcysteine decarboxylase isoform X1 [Amyelois transitella]